MTLTSEQIESEEDHYDDYLRYSQECFGISYTNGNPCNVCDDKKECSEKYFQTHPNDDSLTTRALKTRWKKCSLSELIGADYALRVFRTSPLLRGETLKQCEELINEVRTEINSRPEECKKMERRVKREAYDKSTWLGEKE